MLTKLMMGICSSNRFHNDISQSSIAKSLESLEKSGLNQIAEVDLLLVIFLKWLYMVSLFSRISEVLSAHPHRITEVQKELSYYAVVCWKQKMMARKSIHSLKKSECQQELIERDLLTQFLLVLTKNLGWDDPRNNCVNASLKKSWFISFVSVSVAVVSASPELHLICVSFHPELLGVVSAPFRR